MSGATVRSVFLKDQKPGCIEPNFPSRFIVKTRWHSSAITQDVLGDLHGHQTHLSQTI